ncbi:MAG: hypothetical protein K9K62_10310, partial [Desulfobacteraceae bacterium]|nr:hypothetical protein [Desulfobacteraceae bacterium]
MDRFKNRSRPRKPWLLMVAGALLVACFIVVFAVYQMGTDPAIRGEANTRAMRNDVKSTPGGDASREYRKKIEELNRQQAESAENEGKSYIPSVEGQVSNEEALEENGPDDAGKTTLEQDRAEPDARKRQRKKDEANAQVRAMEKRMQQMQARMQALQQRQQPRGQSQYRHDTSEQDYSRQYGKQ